MDSTSGVGDPAFHKAVIGLMHGDFSRLEPLFDGSPCRITEWYEAGLFGGHQDALNEALSCACFNGKLEVARFLMDKGVDPAAGDATGFNGFHWAANRGQVATVKLLIERKAPLEIKNRFGGTVLGCTVWSAIHEPRPGQLGAIEALVKAGADVDVVGYPTGHEAIDALLSR